MTSPTASNVREGLPPCLSMVKMDSRLAFLDDAAICGHATRERFNVSAGIENGRRSSDPVWATLHPEFEGWELTTLVIDLFTDDPAEAQAAFERGAEYVRTGKLP